MAEGTRRTGYEARGIQETGHKNRAQGTQDTRHTGHTAFRIFQSTGTGIARESRTDMPGTEALSEGLGGSHADGHDCHRIECVFRRKIYIRAPCKRHPHILLLCRHLHGVSISNQGHAHHLGLSDGHRILCAQGRPRRPRALFVTFHFLEQRFISSLQLFCINLVRLDTP
jgi:hypothetical protein